MLKKIIAIKNVGRFRNSAAAGNPQLGKIHVAPLVDRGSVLWTVGRELVADIGQPCLSSIPLNQTHEALASMAAAFRAANLKKMKGAFKFTEGM